MKIFIAGCGRSGTTLIRDLMSCFKDLYVLIEGEHGESPFSRFSSISRQEGHVVIKRTGECWKTLANLPEDIELMYCVRHPFDVLTSTHPHTRHLRRFHITYDRWESEYTGLITLQRAQPNRKVLILRYEDIVHNPNYVQKKISSHFGLIVNHKFSTNPLGIQIFTDSVEKWKRDPELYSYLKTFPHRFRLLTKDFCKRFGYKLPVGYVDGYSESNLDLLLIGVNNPNGLEILDGQPFFWLGGDKTTLDIYSAYEQKIQIHFEAKIGPSFSEQKKRHLRIVSQNWHTMSVIQSGPVKLEVPVCEGENQLVLSVIEQPDIAILPNGDRRPLILGVLNIHIAS